MKNLLLPLLFVTFYTLQSSAHYSKPVQSVFTMRDCHWQLSNLQISTGQDSNGSYVLISGTLSYVCDGKPTFQFTGEIKYYYRKSGNSRVLTGEYVITHYTGDELSEEANEFLKSLISDIL